MIRDFIAAVQLATSDDLLLHFVVSSLIYLAIYYTFTICHFILSHRVYKVTNLMIILIIAAVSLIPEINIVILIFLPLVVALVIAIKLAYIMFIIFDVDVQDKSLCLILKIIIKNIMRSSFRIL